MEKKTKEVVERSSVAVVVAVASVGSADSGVELPAGAGETLRR